MQHVMTSFYFHIATWALRTLVFRILCQISVDSCNISDLFASPYLKHLRRFEHSIVHLPPGYFLELVWRHQSQFIKRCFSTYRRAYHRRNQTIFGEEITLLPTSLSSSSIVPILARRVVSLRSRPVAVYVAPASPTVFTMAEQSLDLSAGQQLLHPPFPPCTECTISLRTWQPGLG